MKSKLFFILFLFSFISYNCFGVPKVIIKFDDLHANNGECRGMEAMDYLIMKQIKFSFGVIANRLDNTALNTLRPYLIATAKELTDYKTASKYITEVDY